MPCNSKHEEFDREKMLSTRCTSCIKAYQDWGAWAYNNEKKVMILKSRNSTAIKQVSGWSSWATSDARKVKILQSHRHAGIEKVVGPVIKK